jgi:hypothetical protein
LTEGARNYTSLDYFERGLMRITARRIIADNFNNNSQS